MTDEWKKVSKKYRPTHLLPSVSIRRDGSIALSANFVRAANLTEYKRASLFLSSDGMKLAICFHNDDDDDAYIVGRDGKGYQGKTLGRLIVARGLIAQSAVLRSLANEDSRVRRYEPQHIDGRWVIRLAPSFEKIAHSIPELPEGSTGIYRYIRGQEIIYIGRGNFRDRTTLKEREHWDFDKIEYSILNNAEVEKKWEAFWLNEFRRKNGSWPRHNKVGGIIDKAVGEDGPS